MSYRELVPYHGRFAVDLGQGRTGDVVEPKIGDRLDIPNRNILRQVEERLAEKGLLLEDSGIRGIYWIIAA